LVRAAAVVATRRSGFVPRRRVRKTERVQVREIDEFGPLNLLPRSGRHRDERGGRHKDPNRHAGGSGFTICWAVTS
jgi:hypothetical protein